MLSFVAAEAVTVVWLRLADRFTSLDRLILVASVASLPLLMTDSFNCAVSFSRAADDFPEWPGKICR